MGKGNNIKRRRIIVYAIVFASAIVCLIGVVIPNFEEAQIRSLISRPRADIRSIATALENYYSDHGVYPPSQMDENGSGTSTFAGNSLSTPVAYLSEYPKDFFAPAIGERFRYQNLEDWWVVWGAGPDEDYDIRFIEVPFSAEDSIPVDVLNQTYDPTNGTVSSGDIWRVRQ